ncbi:hypothetical protein J6590_082698 [Homalodisca vitripennis]|nr:hypothetical protein J6590_082698 [Homalodisca vitripennis]
MVFTNIKKNSNSPSDIQENVATIEATYAWNPKCHVLVPMVQEEMCRGGGGTT